MRSRTLRVLALFLFAVGFVVAACVPPVSLPIRSPVASPQSVAPNLLVNGGFDSPSHYQPKNETSMVLPVGWKAFALDEGGYLKLYESAGVRALGRYTVYRQGIRSGQDSELLKPEVLHICRVAPYLDPPRIWEGECSVTGFKLYGHLAFGVQQTFVTVPGNTYRFSGAAHAWARMSEDPNDAHYSHNVGVGAFYGEEGDANVNDGNDNFRFRLCVDQFGAENIFGSAVQCGRGAFIYNVFHSLPAFTFTARSDSATVFAFADNRFGMLNSNAFFDSFAVEDITPPPTATPSPTPTRRPTATPIPVTPGMTLTCQLTITQRVYVLLPPSSGVEWYEAAIPVVAVRGWSLGTSAVDACVNSCAHRTVIVVNAEQWGCNLFPACHAPCGSLQYQPVAVGTPELLSELLARYPEWLKEAHGVCVPVVLNQ